METKRRNRADCVVVVDYDPYSRLRLKKILTSVDDFKLVGSFSNAGEALPNLPQLQPNLMLLGIRLPRSSSEWIRRFKCMVVGLKIVVITGVGNAELIEASLEAGADSCLVKPVPASQCLATLRFTVYRQIESEFRSPQPKRNVPNGATSRSGLPLSRREHEVLDGLAEGLLYKEIADKLGITYSAVHKYQHKLFEKLQVSNRSEAIRLWHLSTTTGRILNPQSRERATG